MSSWDFPGAKWWKFDFHTHTPVSSDFMKDAPQEEKDEVTPEYWLREFMKKGIDCVAITDHNSGEWVDLLKAELKEIRNNKPEWYRPLHLFPGVEISVNGGIHILAILDPEKTTSDIDRLLGAVGYKGAKGMSDGVTEKAIGEVIDIIHSLDGIAIPAHADKERGLLRQLKGNTLQQVLDNLNVVAVEICEDNYEKPQLYLKNKTNWTEVRGSDVHDFCSQKFGIFTWVKMRPPSIQGLRLALIDGASSTSLDTNDKPNEYADCIIESLEVYNAQYMGRPDLMQLNLSPFLNTIIGGHGSGKSTLLEFMRLVLRRTDELPKHLKETKSNYFSAEADGLLTENSVLKLTYRKGDTRYRLNWTPEADEAAIERFNEERKEWQIEEGEITSLFPVRIYSQKQIYELAGNPQGILRIIDQAGEVQFDDYQRTYQNCVNEYKSTNLQYLQLTQKIQEEKKLKGQLSDLTRQIKHIEKSGHKLVLQNYRRRHQQSRAINEVEEHWQSLLQNIDQSLADFNVFELEEKWFDNDHKVLEELQEKQQEWERRVEQIREDLEEFKKDLRQWKDDKNKSNWMLKFRADSQQYKQLQKQFEEQGINPELYQTLLQQRAVIESELKNILIYKKQTEQLLEKNKALYQHMRKNRVTLTQRRQGFLEQKLREKQQVNITVRPFREAWQDVEQKIRHILQIESHFHKDFENIRDIYGENEWLKVIKLVRGIYHGQIEAKDNRFHTHLQNLPIESIIDLTLWFPDDDLHVLHGPDGKELSTGSPGQKSAALLAFLMSYGDEPLILDQPEDDLDNHLISNMIVEYLKSNKHKRQIIVATHNSNIVVNGDSEMVHPLNVAGGQTHIKSDSLQSIEIRKRICDTMEGGEKAFEQRYKRIHLEYPHV